MNPKRKLNRLHGYDYSLPYAYFITICVQHRQHLFMIEKNVGNDLCVVPPIQNQIIHKWIRETEKKFDVIVDKYVIMPDHLHMIVRFTERHVGRSLPDVIRWFKTMTTNDYMYAVKNRKVLPFRGKLWQKSYYDHIIRGQADYDEIWMYIDNNPLQWELDHK